MTEHPLKLSGTEKVAAFHISLIFEGHICEDYRSANFVWHLPESIQNSLNILLFGAPPEKATTSSLKSGHKSRKK